MGREGKGRAVSILLVEDNPSDARLVEEALGHSGLPFHLHTVSDAGAALRRLRANGDEGAGAEAPDLILLDLNLPGRDGRELLAELKEDSDLCRVPVIVLTASQTQADVLRCYDLHANCYISKPPDWDGLQEVMGSLLRFWLEHAALPPRQGALVTKEPLRVLLVEDNPGDAHLVRQYLREDSGARVELKHVARLEDGIRTLQGGAFDAVLLDLSLPDAQGLETLRKLHAHADRLPIVILTGLEDEALAINAVRHGAQDYIFKGRCDAASLMRAIRHAMERMRGQEHLERLAHHDSLTGLPNRVLLQDRLERALEYARRRMHTLAVLFIDLERFKEVNDTLGHAAGDWLLRCAAERLRGCVRASDTVARVSGDEFMVLLPQVDSLEGVAHIADKILVALRQPVRLGDRDASVTASIGISVYPDDGEEPARLLKSADAAMYRAKRAGGDRHEFFSAGAGTRLPLRLELARELARALDREELTLHYLPTIDSRRRLVGMEALLRWRHPRWGLLRPLEFIPLAEETGLIVDIGQWVMRSACLQQRAWREAGAGTMRLSLNLSPRQLSQGKNLLKMVSQALAGAGIDAPALDVEVTERAIRQDEVVAMETLRELDAMGVGVSLDDFGTGYSALGRLRHFSIGSVKIDRSFISHVTQNPDDAVTVKVLIGMGHGLGVKVIAEGVEREDQLEFLVGEGIDRLQGYHVGRPMSAEASTALLTSPAAPRA